jgi:hypothetical protein
MAQTFSRSIAMADYMVNLEAYKKACINKAKPKMQCNGKCQMYKKINKQENSSTSETQAPKFNLTEPVLSSKSFFPTYLVATYYTSQNYKIHFKINYKSNYCSSIFHPPSFLFV